MNYNYHHFMHSSWAFKLLQVFNNKRHVLTTVLSHPTALLTITLPLPSLRSRSLNPVGV